MLKSEIREHCIYGGRDESIGGAQVYRRVLGIVDDVGVQWEHVNPGGELIGFGRTEAIIPLSAFADWAEVCMNKYFGITLRANQAAALRKLLSDDWLVASSDGGVITVKEALSLAGLRSQLDAELMSTPYREDVANNDSE